MLEKSLCEIKEAEGRAKSSAGNTVRIALR